MTKYIKLIMAFSLALFCLGFMFLATSMKVHAENSSCTKVKASHILVNTKCEAQELKARLDKGEDFATLAKKYSKCPSGQDGGDLGYFERGQMVPEFETATFTLPVGKVSEPVQTQFGWHLIKVYDKK